jgi:hypothetical protein
MDSDEETPPKEEAGVQEGGDDTLELVTKDEEIDKKTELMRDALT